MSEIKQYIMAMDQGTTSSRCILFDREGTQVSSAQREFTQIFPKPGWVEHDPMEIWSSQISVAAEAMGRAGVGPEAIAAIGITNQRETTIVWDRHTGLPVYNAIVWQCRRTADRADALKEQGWSDLIKEHTGLLPDAYFSATKLAWILDNVEGARERAERGDLLFGTVDTWLIWKLTNGEAHVTDYTNASRTMLFNIHEFEWDKEILALLHIPACMLPKVMPSSCVYSVTNKCLIGDGIPIAGAAGDQQAALFGQCCFDEGDAKNTYGTGCFLLMNTGAKAVKSQNGLLTTVAAGAMKEAPAYALEGSVFVAGASIQWLRDEMQLISSAAETELYCNEVPDTNGVYVVPAFTGLGAPWWNQYARGIITGLTRGASKAHVIRATVESLAYQSWDVIHAMEADSGIKLKELKVDGGASANSFLMQFQSELLGGKVIRPKCIETTALGAAYLAGMAVGYWKDKDEIRSNQKIDTVFNPSISEAKRLEALEGWRAAVKRAL